MGACAWRAAAVRSARKSTARSAFAFVPDHRFRDMTIAVTQAMLRGIRATLFLIAMPVWLLCQHV
jgi:hypothetical protein